MFGVVHRRAAPTSSSSSRSWSSASCLCLLYLWTGLPAPVHRPARAQQRDRVRRDEGAGWPRRCRRRGRGGVVSRRDRARRSRAAPARRRRRREARAWRSRAAARCSRPPPPPRRTRRRRRRRPTPPPPGPAPAAGAADHDGGREGPTAPAHDASCCASEAFRVRGTHDAGRRRPAGPAARSTATASGSAPCARAVRADGTFVRRMPTRRKGRFSVRAVHAATPELGAARGPEGARQRRRGRAAQGASGPLVRLLQRGLAKLRYAVPRNGASTPRTGRAVMAFRKVNGMSRRYDADRARDRAGCSPARARSRPRHPDAGRHVEADISRQVLALIDGGKVVATYHTSTGAPATPTSSAASASTARRRARTPWAWSTRPTSSAATRSTATSTCPRSTPATAACACRSRTPRGSSTGCAIGDRVIVYP